MVISDKVVWKILDTRAKKARRSMLKSLEAVGGGRCHSGRRRHLGDETAGCAAALQQKAPLGVSGVVGCKLQQCLGTDHISIWRWRLRRRPLLHAEQPTCPAHRKIRLNRGLNLGKATTEEGHFWHFWPFFQRPDQGPLKPQCCSVNMYQLQ